MRITYSKIHQGIPRLRAVSYPNTDADIRKKCLIKELYIYIMKLYYFFRLARKTRRQLTVDVVEGNTYLVSIFYNDIIVTPIFPWKLN